MIDAQAAENELTSLKARIVVLKDKIDDAYYVFCRSSVAKPPSMAVPGAHAERHQLELRCRAIQWSLQFLRQAEEE